MAAVAQRHDIRDVETEMWRVADFFDVVDLRRALAAIGAARASDQHCCPEFSPRRVVASARCRRPEAPDLLGRTVAYRQWIMAWRRLGHQGTYGASSEKAGWLQGGSEAASRSNPSSGRQAVLASAGPKVKLITLASRAGS